MGRFFKIYFSKRDLKYICYTNLKIDNIITKIKKPPAMSEKKFPKYISNEKLVYEIIKGLQTIGDKF